MNKGTNRIITQTAPAKPKLDAMKWLKAKAREERQAAPRLAADFVLALQAALKAGETWLAEGKGEPRKNSDFGRDAAMLVRMLQNTVGLLRGDLLPFGADLQEFRAQLLEELKEAALNEQQAN